MYWLLCSGSFFLVVGVGGYEVFVSCLATVVGSSRPLSSLPLTLYFMVTSCQRRPQNEQPTTPEVEVGCGVDGCF